MAKKTTLFVLAAASLAVLWTAVPARAESLFQSSDEFGKWITFYYQEPDPPTVLPALVYFCDTLHGVQNNSRMAVAEFFAALMRKDKKLAENAYREITKSGSDDSKLFLANVLWLAATPQTKDLLERALGEWPEGPLLEVLTNQIAAPPLPLLTAPLSPPIMDMLWANFSATADPAPVRRVIEAAVSREKAEGGHIATAEAAIWSLGSNVKQHPKVRAICEQELAKAQGSAKEILGKIVDGSWVQTTAE